MNLKKSLSTMFVLLLTTALSVTTTLADEHAGHRAVAVIQTTSAEEAPDAKVMCRIFFEEKDGSLHLMGHITGLKPNSEHGFHIHQYGDLSEDDGTSAGGHFNPQDTPHAGPQAKAHHVGDLGNIKADKNGHAEIHMELKYVQLDEGPQAILGRALVVHAGQDDLKSQPSGDAGSRIGVGIIGWANPESKEKK